MPKQKDIPSGTVFSRLTVIGPGHLKTRSDGRLRPTSLCRCICGVEKVVENHELKKGSVSSCGCLALELIKNLNFKHGQTRTKLYRAWINMRLRCYNEKDCEFQNYGGRGITVCERWSDFINFREDMGDPPQGMTLDRLDNNGNYEKSNCRWADRFTQARNKRNNVIFVIQGIRACAAEHCERIGISQELVCWRIKSGQSPEEAFLSPIRHVRVIPS